MNEPEVENRAEQWLTRLQETGHRLTAPRRVVVNVLAESDRALNAVEIYDLAREKYALLGLVSVYRTLEMLERLNLIQRVHQPDGCQAFIAAFNGHQHLLLCERCGLVEFFRGDNIDELVSRVEKESGYRVKEHWLQFFGVCRSCQSTLD